MAKIDGIIPNQHFELVRDRIATILVDELAEQYTLSSNEDINVQKVWMERVWPFHENELPAVNVCFSHGPYEKQDIQESMGNYIYHIDCYHSAKSTDDDNGDKLGNIKLQRLLGVCRAIIENPQYNTLDFAPPFIRHREIQKIMIAQAKSGDVNNMAMGRLELLVRVHEDTQLVGTIAAGGYDTTVYLSETDKGYFYNREVQ